MSRTRTKHSDELADQIIIHGPDLHFIADFYASVRAKSVQFNLVLKNWEIKVDDGSWRSDENCVEIKADMRHTLKLNIDCAFARAMSSGASTTLIKKYFNHYKKVRQFLDSDSGPQKVLHKLQRKTQLKEIEELNVKSQMQVKVIQSTRKIANKLVAENDRFSKGICRGKKIIAEAMSKARDQLNEYIDQYKREQLELPLESPVWFAELEQCKTLSEIIEYMNVFSPTCKFCHNPVNILTLAGDEPNHFHVDCAFLADDFAEIERVHHAFAFSSLCAMSEYEAYDHFIGL